MNLATPSVMFLSLNEDASVCELDHRIDFNANCIINGVTVEAEGNPWYAWADLLIDVKTREFIGLSYAIDEEPYIEQMRMFGSSAGSHVKFVEGGSARPCANKVGRYASIEMMWSLRLNRVVELADLCDGQWWWWYPKGYVFQVSPVALSLSGIDRVLQQHHLQWPDITKCRTLDVAFV